MRHELGLYTALQVCGYRSSGTHTVYCVYTVNTHKHTHTLTHL